MNELVTTDKQLIARTPAELTHAHGELVKWCDQRIAEHQRTQADEEESLAIAQERHWRRSSFKSRIKRAEKLVLFYQKVRKALEAGYFLVPNFQMDVFAIRTKRTKPRGGVKVSTGRYPSIDDFTQNAEQLPAGEGEYKDPDPIVSYEKTGEGDEKAISSWPEKWEDPAFPFELASPAVMTRTGESMAVKLFDEVGIARDGWGGGRGDPMILGRFTDPRPNRIGVTFFIAWGMDFDRF